MSLYQDSKKSYYNLLAQKLLYNNSPFTIRSKSGVCVTVGKKPNFHHTQFIRWAERTAKILKSESGNIIPIDDSILDNFPPVRPVTCLPAGVKQPLGGQVYWKKKEEEYKILKKTIDEKLELLKEIESKKIIEKEKLKSEIIKPEIIASSSLLPLAVIGYLVLKK